jgi:hypothetical protein
MPACSIAVFFLFVPLLAWGEVESDIPLGVKAVTGYRTELVHRGYVLADDVFDFQLVMEIVLSDAWSVGMGGYYGRGSVHDSNEDFSQITRDTNSRYASTQFP